MYLKSLYIGVIATCDRTVLLLKHPEREKRHSDNRGQNPLRPFRQIHHFKDFPLTFNCDTPLARKPPPSQINVVFICFSILKARVGLKIINSTLIRGEGERKLLVFLYILAIVSTVLTAIVCNVLLPYIAVVLVSIEWFFFCKFAGVNNVSASSNSGSISNYYEITAIFKQFWHVILMTS